MHNPGNSSTRFPRFARKGDTLVTAGTGRALNREGGLALPGAYTRNGGACFSFFRTVQYCKLLGQKKHAYIVYENYFC